MSRRPLGSSLPPEVRAAALEATVREFYAAVDDELVAAIYALDTGRDIETDARVSPTQAVGMIRRASVHLQEIRAYGIRAPRNGAPAVDGQGARP